VLAEYCAPHFADHMPELRKGLRKKLDKYDSYIETVRGVGYRFKE